MLTWNHFYSLFCPALKWISYLLSSSQMVFRLYWSLLSGSNQVLFPSSATFGCCSALLLITQAFEDERNIIWAWQEIFFESCQKLEWRREQSRKKESSSDSTSQSGPSAFHGGDQLQITDATSAVGPDVNRTFCFALRGKVLAQMQRICSHPSCRRKEGWAAPQHMRAEITL